MLVRKKCKIAAVMVLALSLFNPIILEIQMLEIKIKTFGIRMIA